MGDDELDAETLARLDEVSTPQAELYPYGAVAVKQRHRPLTPTS